MSVDTTEAPQCYSSVTTTLSRPKGEKQLWNMRTVKVPGPTAGSSEFCLNTVEDYVDEWVDYGTIELSCKKMKL